MKKTMLVAALVVVSGLSGSTQSTHSLQWGDATPLEADESGVQRESRKGPGYFTIDYVNGGRVNSTRVTARLYDANFRKEREAKFEFKKVSKLAFRPEWERMINVGGRYYFLLKELDIGGKQTHLLAWAFDPETLTIAKDAVILATVKVLDSILSTDSLLTTYHWTIDISGDRLHVLEASSKAPAPATLVVKTYDPRLTLQSERSFSVAPEFAFLVVNGFSLEYGHLVISARNFERKPRVFTNDPDRFKVVYFIVPDGTQRLQVVNVDLPGVQVSQSRHIFLGPDEFLSYGLYSKTDVDVSAGAYFVRYSMKQSRLDAPQLRSFPGAIVESADFRDNRVRSRNPGQVPNFSVADLRVRADGGLQFIAEQTNNRFQSSTVTNWAGTMSTTWSGTMYEYDDIMVYTLYPDPSRDWFSLIRKRQQGIVDREYSFTHTYDKNGRLWLLYNDLPKNLSLPPSKAPDSLKESENGVGTVLVSVDPRGNVRRELLFTKMEVGHALAPRLTEYLPDGAIRLAGFGKKSYRVGVLRLPQ